MVNLNNETTTLKPGFHLFLTTIEKNLFYFEDRNEPISTINCLSIRCNFIEELAVDKYGLLERKGYKRNYQQIIFLLTIKRFIFLKFQINLLKTSLNYISQDQPFKMYLYYAFKTCSIYWHFYKRRK